MNLWVAAAAAATASHFITGVCDQRMTSAVYQQDRNNNNDNNNDNESSPMVSYNKMKGFYIEMYVAMCLREKVSFSLYSQVHKYTAVKARLVPFISNALW